MARGLSFIEFLVLPILAVVTGCAGNNDPTSPPVDSQQFVAARKLFDMHCAKCHTIGAAAEDGPQRTGPDLGKVAALNPQNTHEWLRRYIRDPRTQNAKSKMPKFGDKLSDKEVDALADFLASLK